MTQEEWDTMLTSGQTKILVKLAKDQDHRNSITVHATTSSEKPKIWFFQDSSTSPSESMVVFAPVDIDGMQSMMAWCDSSSLPILTLGFSILPNWFENRPLVITSRLEDRATEGGSLLTIAFQILANSSPSLKLTMESMETVNALISCTLQHTKKAFQCEDG